LVIKKEYKSYFKKRKGGRKGRKLETHFLEEEENKRES
jgi:hypothetical protein